MNDVEGVEGTWFLLPLVCLEALFEVGVQSPPWQAKKESDWSWAWDEGQWGYIIRRTC